MAKDPPVNEETFDPWVRKFPLEEEKVTHSSILAWKIPWTEEPGSLQSIESQRVGLRLSTHIHSLNCHNFLFCFADVSFR